MANPQAENGHVDISNEVAEAFERLQLSGYQWRVLWVILRQTWGWHKKADRISLSFFSERTGLKEKHVSRALKELIEMNVVARDADTYIKTYSLQKDYEVWKPSPKLGTPKLGIPKNGDGDSPKLGGKPSPKLGGTKENKETTQKKGALRASFDVFCKAYPKRKARRDALKAWEKLNPSPELQQTILAAIEKQKASEDWQKDKGKFIPYPATWLNGHRWEDEVQEVKPSW